MSSDGQNTSVSLQTKCGEPNTPAAGSCRSATTAARWDWSGMTTEARASYSSVTHSEMSRPSSKSASRSAKPTRSHLEIGSVGLIGQRQGIERRVGNRSTSSCWNRPGQPAGGSRRHVPS